MSMLRVLLPAFGAGLVFTPVSGEKLAFGPPAGSTLTKTFTVGGEYELDHLSLNVNGQDLEGMLPAIEMSLKAETKIEVTDTYKAVEDGRPTHLLRTFDALSATTTMEMTPAETELPKFESTSPLEGKTVAFKWNPEKKEYEHSFEESEGEDSWLEDLDVEMDLRPFLPAGEVAEGDSWTVPLGDLKSVVMPGGNLRLKPEGVEVDEEAMKMFEGMFEQLGNELCDLLEGECKCTFKGLQEEDGARVAEIAIELQVSTTLDLASFLDKAIRAAIEQQGVGDQVKLSVDTADLNVDFDGTGTLLWNLTQNRVHSLQIAGDVTIDIDLAVSAEAEGQAQKFDASLEMSGTMREDVATKE